VGSAVGRGRRRSWRSQSGSIRIGSRQPVNQGALEHGSIQSRDSACARWRRALQRKDVGEDVADLARRAQHAGVVALGEQRAAPAQVLVDAAGEADHQALHPAGERVVAGGLDDEVEVVAEDAVLDDAEVVAWAQRAADDRDDRVAAQRGQPVDDAQRDVEREARREPLAGRVRDPGPPARSAGARPPAAAAARPAGVVEGELRVDRGHREGRSVAGRSDIPRDCGAIKSTRRAVDRDGPDGRRTLHSPG
jgi:hypothetical protein